MSASLVGSEMCIRDRDKDRGRPVDDWMVERTDIRTDGRTDRLVRSKPVSYTHLTLPTICSV
eukprot:3609729-Alexandrium_andersonii.AAC.1